VDSFTEKVESVHELFRYCELVNLANVGSTVDHDINFPIVEPEPNREGILGSVY